MFIIWYLYGIYIYIYIVLKRKQTDAAAVTIIDTLKIPLAKVVRFLAEWSET